MKSVKVFDDLSMMPIGVMNLNQLRDEMGDAVVESVEVVDGNLVITFNTASGKQPITIPLSELSQPLIIETTYAELVAAKNGGTLAKGAWYRITDYVTTTVQSNTQSAGHAFDVIVRADSESVLNENAFAIQHEGDTYFANQKLSSWELKYDINNDTTKYAWADATNGKGVIYYMKDENDNECPYDFKNIQFKVGANRQAGTVDNVFYFTFSVATGTNDATVTDHSLNGAYCYGNKMGLYVPSNKRSLNANVFRNTYAVGNCKSNTFIDMCYDNIFGNSCEENNFGHICYGNRFGGGCVGNTFGNNCHDNKFENACVNNTLGDVCYGNNLGNANAYNKLGNNCYNNSFGNMCKNNTLREGCAFNTFKDSCDCNALENGCISNAFGNGNSYNKFGNGCSSNTFGNGCFYNSFGDNCIYNTFGTSSDTKSYYQNIVFENGVKYVLLDCTQTTSSSIQCQNVLVGMGVAGTSSSKKTLTVATARNTFKTVFKTANDVEVTA